MGEIRWMHACYGRKTNCTSHAPSYTSNYLPTYLDDELVQLVLQVDAGVGRGAPGPCRGRGDGIAHHSTTPVAPRPWLFLVRG